MIAWVDVETTGLNPRTDHLLEVALVITDDELEEIRAYSTLVLPVGFRAHDVPMDDYVRQMHTKNGLLEALADCDTYRYEAEQNLFAFLKMDFASLKQTPLAGSTVSFDRAFLREHMPKLEAMFSYRSIDVSSLTELAKRWAPDIYAKRPGADKKKEDLAHRALADVRESIAILKYYRETQFILKNRETVWSPNAA